MKSTRRTHGAPFKAQVALAAVKGDKTLAELAEHFRVQPTQITEWKEQLLARAADVLADPNRRRRRRISKPSTPRSDNWPWRMIF